jgi:hypothetical protein
MRFNLNRTLNIAGQGLGDDTIRAQDSAEAGSPDFGLRRTKNDDNDRS